MADHTNDLLGVLALLVNSLADRIGVAKVSAGKDLVDYHDGQRSFIILTGEEATLLKRDAHHRQIARFDSVDQRHIHFTLTCRLWPTVDPEEQIVLALQRN